MMLYHLYAIFFYAMTIFVIISGIVMLIGKTDMTHDYHTKNNTNPDHKKTFGKASLFMGVFYFLGGSVALLGDEWIFPALGIFLSGAMLGTLYIFLGIRKGNRSIE
ncbi:MAG: hypothetical protein FWH46_01280 [Methanimicrococcus sp.]|nr:hypothetical protein [Methanimicrococcus sp.]